VAVWATPLLTLSANHVKRILACQRLPTAAPLAATAFADANAAIP